MKFEDKLISKMKEMILNADTIKDDWYTSERDAYKVIFADLLEEFKIDSKKLENQ